MAVKRVRFCRITADGTTTTFHLETSSDIVLRPDGTSVEQTLQALSKGIGSGGGTGGTTGGASSEEFTALKDQVGVLATAALGHATTEQLKALETKLQAQIDKKADRGTPVKFTIAANAWITDSTDGYPYYYNIAATGVTAKDVATITISPSSVDAAAAAVICPTLETISGAIRIRAKNQPTGVISGEYYIS